VRVGEMRLFREIRAGAARERAAWERAAWEGVWPPAPEVR